MNTVKEIQPVLKSVKFEKDRRNISQQIIDQIITGNEKRYAIYQELRDGREGGGEDSRQAASYFFSQWVPLERMLNRISNRNSQKLRGAFNINTLNRMNVLDKDCLNQHRFPAQEPQHADPRYRGAGGRLHHQTGGRGPGAAGKAWGTIPLLRLNSIPQI